MQVHDVRRNKKKPIPPELKRLQKIVVACSRDESHQEAMNLFIADYDERLGTGLHLRMNWEPKWITESFKAKWRALYGRTLQSSLLQDECDAYAWGVWES